MNDLREGFGGRGNAGKPGSAGSEPADRRALLRRLTSRADAESRLHRRKLITETFAERVLPKLVQQYQPTPQARTALPDAGRMRDFIALVLANDLHGCTGLIRDITADGATLPRICVDLLAPAARRLGEMWEQDLCTFIEVTAGLGTLHALMIRLHDLLGDGLPIRDHDRRILLASVTGAQHTFGLAMVAEVFSQSGWDVTMLNACDTRTLAAVVRGESFAIAGLTAASTADADKLAPAVVTIRRASRNRAIGVMVGGPALGIDPALAEHVGADISAKDAEDAVFRAEGLRLLLAG